MASFCLPDWFIYLFLKCCLGTPQLFAVPMPFSRVISSANTYIFLHSSGQNCAPSVRNVLWVISMYSICVWKELCISNNGSLNYFRQHIFRAAKNSFNFRDSRELWLWIRHPLHSAGRCSEGWQSCTNQSQWQKTFCPGFVQLQQCCLCRIWGTQQ